MTRVEVAGEDGVVTMIGIETPDGALAFPLEEARAIARMLAAHLAAIDAGESS